MEKIFSAKVFQRDTIYKTGTQLQASVCSSGAARQTQTSQTLWLWLAWQIEVKETDGLFFFFYFFLLFFLSIICQDSLTNNTKTVDQEKISTPQSSSVNSYQSQTLHIVPRAVSVQASPNPQVEPRFILLRIVFGLLASLSTTPSSSKEKEIQGYFLSPLPHNLFFFLPLFWVNSSLVADSTGPAECCETCIVTDMTPTSLMSNLRRHQHQRGVMENLCFVRKLTLVLLKESECPTLHSSMRPSEAGCGGPGATSCLTLNIYKEKNVKPGNTVLSEGQNIPTQAHNESFAYMRNK